MLYMYYIISCKNRGANTAAMPSIYLVKKEIKGKSTKNNGVISQSFV